MNLSRFSVIVCIDSKNGIAKDGVIPWKCPEDMRFFRETTIGNGKNCVIMGRKTFEFIPPENRPLKGRFNIVLSKNQIAENNNNLLIVPSIYHALAKIGSCNVYDKVWICGGQEVYKEIIEKFLYLCDEIIVTRLKVDYQCDRFFPYEKIEKLQKSLTKPPVIAADYTRLYFTPNVRHEEYQYLSLLRKLLDEGELKEDRTKVGTKFLFGQQLEFDISNSIPLLTTKKVFFKGVLKELLFFISGKTDTKILEKDGVNIWKQNTRKAFLESKGLSYPEGCMGPSYGFQLRHFNAFYEGPDADYQGKGVDQLTKIIEEIKTNPDSRRLVLTYWNPVQTDEMVLPPCCYTITFNVSGDRKYLDCQVIQRSGDMFLGVPFNICQYSILTYMICHLTGLKPRKYVHSISNCHIYLNHLQQAEKQLTRNPFPFPKLEIKNGFEIHTIDDFKYENFELIDYNCWGEISAPMAV